MAQSVELLLDPAAEVAVRAEWTALADAGLPSERRSTPSPHHGPHVTLYAGDEITPAMNAALSELVSGLVVTLELGAVTFFGPHRGSYVCVHPLVPTRSLLALQERVASVCGAEPAGHFGPGRWTPHVTVARRVRDTDAGAVLAVAAGADVTGLAAEVTRCRRWDSVARTAWLLQSAG